MVDYKKSRCLFLCLIWAILAACHKEPSSIPYTEEPSSIPYTKEPSSIPYTDVDPYSRIFYVHTTDDSDGVPQQTLCEKDYDSDSECLTDASMDSFIYVWSPDGKWVVFKPYGEDRLYIMSSTGEHMRQIAESKFINYPQWLSNDVLVFRAFDSAILMDISTDETITIAEDVGALSLSTNKELIVFTASRHIYLLDVDELTITELVDDKWIYRGDFAWSTDDRYIVTKRIEKESWQVSQLVVIDVETGNIQVVDEGVDHAARYAWSPDGDWLAFDVLLDEGEGISFVNIEDGTIYKVIDIPNIFIDAWSENGRGIIGSQKNMITGQWSLVLLDIESEDIEVIADCGFDWCNTQLR